MLHLSTIQKREKLNEVYAVDKKGNGGAHYDYMICAANSAELTDGDKSISVNPGDVMGEVHFQNGARKLDDSIHGVLDTDLLEIVRHRLQCFQQGPLSSRENAVALTHIEEALMWMNRRVEDRIERNVLGTNNK